MRAQEIIRAVLDVLDQVDTVDAQPCDDPVGYTDDDLPRIRQIAGLIPQDDSMSVLANRANPQYADVDAVVASGDDVHKSKHPADIRSDAASMFPFHQHFPE